MKIMLSVELGDDETPLVVATMIEKELKRLYGRRKVLVGDGTGLYSGDDREINVIHFEA